MGFWAQVLLAQGPREPRGGVGELRAKQTSYSCRGLQERLGGRKPRQHLLLCLSAPMCSEKEGEVGARLVRALGTAIGGALS